MEALLFFTVIASRGQAGIRDCLLTCLIANYLIEHAG
jgi:hypothetical protein